MTRKLLIFRRKIAQLRPRPIFVRVKLFPGRLKFGGMILSWAVLWLCSPVSGRLKLFNRCWSGAGVGASVGGGKQAAMGTHQQQQHHQQPHHSSHSSGSVFITHSHNCSHPTRAINEPSRSITAVWSAKIPTPCLNRFFCQCQQTL